MCECLALLVHLRSVSQADSDRGGISAGRRNLVALERDYKPVNANRRPRRRCDDAFRVSKGSANCAHFTKFRDTGTHLYDMRGNLLRIRVPSYLRLWTSDCHLFAV